ncbi:MAG TPA: glycosyltransferase family 39 protein [Stellaceae bacterium]|nr:glycosyltransferase family 39 protein [Stellaceae bacterium]
MTLTAVAALTVLRLAWLAVTSANLYPDEAQYWFWAQHLAFGYYSKPPLVAWLIALTTGLFGDSEFAIRLSAPLLHAGAAGFVYGIAARLYDRRVGFWAALAYATLPGVSLSSFLISTDAVLVPCWAAALYAFIRARHHGETRWWVATGIAVGLGLLAKYAMAYWLISAFLVVVLLRDERRHLRGLLLAVAVAAVFYLPNLWWNWSHGFASYLHVRDNAELKGPLFHPLALVEFLVSQFAVFGPILCAWLVALCLRPGRLGAANARLLAAFALPTLLMVTVVSLLSRAQPNWAAPAYVSAVILVVGTMLAQNWRRILAFSIALNLAAVAGVFVMSEGIAVAGIAVPAKYDPLHRLRGWRPLGETVGKVLAAHPGLLLMADDRELLAALIYYVRPHPFGAVEWNVIPGITDQWRLKNNLKYHRGEDFLAVTEHGLTEQMRPQFDTLTPLQTIDTASGPGGGQRYTLYIARGYRGDQPGG